MQDSRIVTRKNAAEWSGVSMSSQSTIGFIGVGEIAEAIVEGLMASDAPPPVHLSPRGRERAASLSTRFPDQVTVAGSNQEVVDAADTVVLAVLPDQLTEVVGPLEFRDDQVVISALAGVTIAEVAAAVGAPVPVIRAIPMPPVRDRTVATVITPEHPAATALFDRTGGTLPVAGEDDLAVFSAATGAVSGYLQYLAVVCAWTESRGVPRESGEQFLRGLFGGLSAAILDGSRSISDIVTAHETPGGLNEQLREDVFDQSGTDALTGALDRLHARVTGGD